LKNLPPRPLFKPSGIERATQPKSGKPGKHPGRGVAAADRQNLCGVADTQTAVSDFLNRLQAVKLFL